MDAAWRQAISEGMKKANAAAGRGGDRLSSYALKALPKNEKVSSRIVGAVSGAALPGSAIGAAAVGGSVAGGTLGGLINKALLKTQVVRSSMAKKNPALLAALDKSGKLRKSVELPQSAKNVVTKVLGSRAVNGAVAGARFGVRQSATRILPAMSALGAVAGGSNKAYGEKRLNDLKVRAARHEARKATTANKIPKS